MSVSKDSLYNLAGQVIPMAVGVIAVPILIRHLGATRVGVLSLAWVIVGYSGLLDFGLSRSLIQVVADLRARSLSTEIPSVYWTALILAIPFSVICSLGFFLGASAFIERFLKLSPDLVVEGTLALRIFAASVAPAILTPLLLGFLTAFRRFDLVNQVKLPTGILMTGGPAVAALLGYKLPAVMAVLAIARIIALVWCFILSFKVLPELRCQVVFKTDKIKALMSFGFWVTVTNVVSPVLVYCDRFFIGLLLSASFVAYYATPADVITKLLVLPMALSSALFPLLTERAALSLEECRRLLGVSLQTTFVILFPLSLSIVFFGREGLTLWLGMEFATHSLFTLQVLAVGIIFNGLAQLPATWLQAVGKPAIAAKFHILEFVVYVPLLYIAVKHCGIAGAASAWVLRVVVDTILLYSQTCVQLGYRFPLSIAGVIRILFLSVLALSGLFLTPLLLRSVVYLILCAVFSLWFRREIVELAGRMKGVLPGSLAPGR